MAVRIETQGAVEGAARFAGGACRQGGPAS
jgi:hypothetical protein